MDVDAKGYEEKPWWPYVLDLQQKIDAGGGGGGSSDFSTAQVTVVNNANIDITVQTPYYVEAEGEAPAYSCGAITVEASSDIILNIVMYKGTSLMFADSGNFTVSGDGLEVMGGAIGISGNGTVTFTNTQ